MKVKVAILNAFIDGDTGGNPAGVVLESDALTDLQKINIAKQVGLSETAFVSASNTAGFKLDFFTPQKQIAHCGHATIATFSYLSQLGLITGTKTSKETIDGNRNIEIQGDFAYMEQLAPSYITPAVNNETLAKAIGVKPNELVAEPIIANTGNSFLVLGVKDIATLERLKPDYDLINELSDTYDLIGFYVFTTQTNKAGRDASTRMFAPRYGITEESATGMAAGPLACFLYDYMSIKKDTLVIEQGYSMTPASPSCIEVSLTIKDNNITSLKAGGIGKPSSFKEVDIE